MNLGIIGLGKIGQSHARIFNSLGINVKSVISSQLKNAQNSSKDLSNKYNFQPDSYDSIKNFLNSNIHAVSICSPFTLHYDHIISCLNKNMFIFIEKPFFWEMVNKEVLLQKLEIIKNHQNRKIMLNLNNSKIISKIDSLPKRNEINDFKFKFHTNGNNKYEHILIDLLPHALSILTELVGLDIINNLKKNVKENTVSIDFKYGKTLVNFHFSQSSNIEKKMIIKVNKNMYKRVQEGFGETYKLYMLDETNNQKYLIEDTLKSSIKKFINFYRNFNSNKQDFFNEAEINFNLMNQIINS